MSKAIIEDKNNEECFNAFLTAKEIKIVEKESLEIVLSPNSGSYYLYSNEIDAYWDSGVYTEEELDQLVDERVYLKEKWLFGDVEI